MPGPATVRCATVRAARAAHYAKVYRLLASASGRTAFVAGERSWLAYRRSTCAASSSRYAGGSLQPVAFAQCEQSVNLTHLRELAARLRELAG